MITVKLKYRCEGRCNDQREIEVDIEDLYAISDEDDKVCKGIDTDVLPEGWTWQRPSYERAYPFCAECTELWDVNKKVFKEKK